MVNTIYDFAQKSFLRKNYYCMVDFLGTLSLKIKSLPKPEQYDNLQPIHIIYLTLGCISKVLNSSVQDLVMTGLRALDLAKFDPSPHL